MRSVAFTVYLFDFFFNLNFPFKFAASGKRVQFLWLFWHISDILSSFSAWYRC